MGLIYEFQFIMLKVDVSLSSFILGFWNIAKKFFSFCILYNMKQVFTITTVYKLTNISL